MPQTNNIGRAYVKQYDRIQVTRTGSMILLPQGYQFTRMTIEQFCEIDAESLIELEKAAFTNRIEHLIELEEMRLQRIVETRKRQLDYIKKYRK